MCLFIMSLFLQTNFPSLFFFAFFRPRAARWIKQKMFQKSSKIPPKIIHNFVLKPSRDHRVPYLGGVLGESWGVLGRPGVSWTQIDASCGRPGGVLGRLGSVLGPKRWPTWLQLGSQNGTNIEKKVKQKTFKIMMPLEVVFFFLGIYVDLRR